MPHIIFNAVISIIAVIIMILIEVIIDIDIDTLCYPTHCYSLIVRSIQLECVTLVLKRIRESTFSWRLQNKKCHIWGKMTVQDRTLQIRRGTDLSR